MSSVYDCTDDEDVPLQKERKDSKELTIGDKENEAINNVAIKRVLNRFMQQAKTFSITDSHIFE